MADSRKSRDSSQRRSARRERSSRERSSRERSSRENVAEQERGGLQSVLARWAEAAAIALVVARILVPTEGAVQGDTLWIALLWFPLAAIWLMVHPVAGGPAPEIAGTPQHRRLRNRWFRLADAGILLLAAGHILATGGVFVLGGNRRSAVNLTWEWIALAAAWFVLRSMLNRPGFRRQLAVALVALAVAESGYGIWQHYVWYPETAGLYTGIRSELDELESRPGLTSAEEARRKTLQGQLLERQIPLEGPARSLWENRLKASTEPFGTFALANSFAGFLAAWLFVALGFALVPLLPWARQAGATPSRTVGSVAACLAVLLPLLLCLLLTKSRTAWVGTSCGTLLVAGASWIIWRQRAAGSTSCGAAAGMAAAGGQANQADDSSAGKAPSAVRAAATEKVSSKEVTDLAGPTHEETVARPPLAAGSGQKRVRLAFALALLVLLGGLAAGLMSLDAEVLLEAPRSVRFRLQYWHGAARVIEEHPLLGVGPGNFRQHYLAHKLPESSEEIADPHNLILDCWASGGLTALCGLLLLLITLGSWCWHTGRRLNSTSAELFRSNSATYSDSPAQQNRPVAGTAPALAFSAAVVGGCAGFLLVLLSTELTGGGSEPASWLMFGGWIGMLLILRNRSNPAGLLCVGCLAGAVALAIHLSGAGGIEMPAIVETLFLLLLLGGTILADQQAVFAAGLRQTTGPVGKSSRTAPSVSQDGSQKTGRGRLTAGTVGCFVLAVLCWSTAAGPEWQRRIETVLGDAELMQTGRIDVAERHYQRAAVLDPLSPDPVARLAELAFRRWQSAPELNEYQFEEAVQLQKLAIRQDPAGPGGFRRLGEYWLARAERSGKAQHAAESVRAYRSAIQRYPAYALLRADFARALQVAGDEQAAREQAEEALRLNEINRQQGHTDKLLDQERMKKLESLLGESALPED